MTLMDPPARLLPDVPLPSYTYIPGRFPHPVSDPSGHSFGTARAPEPCTEPRRWRENRPYLRGLDLFNGGYYWEAHEAWEQLWLSCDHRGVTASFLKALIKLAAAGVKVRQAQPAGVRHHARRAAELIAQVQKAASPSDGRYMGLSLAEVAGFAETIAREPPASVLESFPATHVFPSFLNPA